MKDGFERVIGDGSKLMGVMRRMEKKTKRRIIEMEGIFTNGKRERNA
eukprot:CAMPEP_0168316286 /NCGR_PEP_ID=MMETSP0210-20121227/15145_1 /TAXON_ID=40633 /ORGANISM="Condylostoma magnum, Strain COL2" /LENGTH=46 /DNA_ID= /DNA_START= /DNA_END= /DNA_ORIENTATION=